MGTYIARRRYFFFELSVKSLRELHLLQDRQGCRFVVDKGSHGIYSCHIC